MTLEKELQLAKQAAKEAAQAILKYYRLDHLKVSHKSDDAEQPVTQADLESNQIIKKILQEAFPRDGWLSEEDPDNPERFAKERVWIVDPLDGTKDFIHKNPEFAVSIGLVQNHKPILGVVCNPVTDELFWGVKGEGAFYNDQKITVCQTNGKNSIRLIVSQSEYRRGEWEKFKEDFEIKAVGGTAYKLALVAMGKAEGCFTLQPKSEWDICAGHLLIEEAGGMMTTAEGKEVCYNQKHPRFQNLVYCSPHVHSHILERIAQKS